MRNIRKGDRLLIEVEATSEPYESLGRMIVSARGDFGNVFVSMNEIREVLPKFQAGDKVFFTKTSGEPVFLNVVYAVGDRAWVSDDAGYHDVFKTASLKRLPECTEASGEDVGAP